MDNLWEALIVEEKFDLIEKLRHVENKDAGFGTIAVSKEGFSENDRTHNMVVKWLKENNVHVISVMNEIGSLELALFNKTLE